MCTVNSNREMLKQLHNFYSRGNGRILGNVVKTLNVNSSKHIVIVFNVVSYDVIVVRNLVEH